jgi:hypothetical protein
LNGTGTGKNAITRIFNTIMIPQVLIHAGTVLARK